MDNLEGSEAAPKRQQALPHRTFHDSAYDILHLNSRRLRTRELADAARFELINKDFARLLFRKASIWPKNLLHFSFPGIPPLPFVCSFPICWHTMAQQERDETIGKFSTSILIAVLLLKFLCDRMGKAKCDLISTIP